jgi:hypothetical protein
VERSKRAILALGWKEFEPLREPAESAGPMVAFADPPIPRVRATDDDEPTSAFATDDAR